jgi:uncharacterized protein YcfJ
MDKSLILSFVAGGVAMTAAGAIAGYQAMNNRRSAEVLNVEQLTRTVRTPRQECYDQIVTRQAPRNDPKRVTGAVFGSKIQKHVQRCGTVYDSAQQPDGYQVRYRLDDRERTVRMEHDPGRRIPVENGELVLTPLVIRR